MDTQPKQASDLSADYATRQAEHIQAELIHLIYKQSYVGITITIINAVALTYLIWYEVDQQNLVFWFSSLLLITGLRAVLVYQYHHSRGSAYQTKLWGRIYIIGLALTGILWGSTMVITFPSDSLTHQLCIALLLCGIIATAISLYAVVPLAIVAFSLPIFLAWIFRFLNFNDPIHMIIAGMAMLYLGIMILTSHNIARTHRQLLTTRFDLANRVSEGSQALKESNAYLQTEIKDRKNIEERLRQERDRLETITTTIGAGLAVISKKYRLLWTNRIFEDIFGGGVGKPCYTAQFQRDSQCETCGARTVFEEGSEKVVHERECLNVDGKPMWFQIVTTPIRNEEGRIRAALALVLPITERKEAEAAQFRMTQKLQEARKTEAIATLAGGIAHQFNNALAVISGNIELLEYDYQSDQHIKSFAAPILKASRKMARLTNQLLAYAQGGKYKEQPTDLGEVVETTISLIKHTIAKTIRLKTVVNPDLPKMRIDITQIQMVISSIVSNAVEATEHGGQINIFCKSVAVTPENQSRHNNIPLGNYVAFITADDGIGMDSQTLKRIFEPFFTTKFEGRGLGMAAVYGIIKNHAGHIHVTSKPEEGTRVSIYLPAVEQTSDLCCDTYENELPVRGSGTILVIEDDIAIIEVNKVWLKRIGYNATTATTAHEAIEIVRHSKTQFDAVLLDLVLPDMDGAALFPHIRKHLPQTKVIICSGYGQAGSTQELLDAGANGFLQKPFTLNQVSKKLNQVLNTSPAKP
jgi:PAS domain S-box-containing protein